MSGGWRQADRRGSSAPVSDPDDAAAAAKTALQILDGADQSSTDLERRLLRRGYSADTARQAVTAMREYGYVNDEELARSVARRRQRQGYGRLRIESDLGQRGLALAEAADPEAERARAIELAQDAWGHRRGADDEADRARIARRLQRRGFSGSDVAAALRALPRDEA